MRRRNRGAMFGPLATGRRHDRVPSDDGRARASRERAFDSNARPVVTLPAYVGRGLLVDRAVPTRTR